MLGVDQHLHARSGFVGIQWKSDRVTHAKSNCNSFDYGCISHRTISGELGVVTFDGCRLDVRVKLLITGRRGHFGVELLTTIGLLSPTPSARIYRTKCSWQPPALPVAHKNRVPKAFECLRPEMGSSLLHARLFLSEGDHGFDPRRPSGREITRSRDGNHQGSHRYTDGHGIVRMDTVEQ